MSSPAAISAQGLWPPLCGTDERTGLFRENSFFTWVAHAKTLSEPSHSSAGGLFCSLGGVTVTCRPTAVPAAAPIGMGLRSTVAKPVDCDSGTAEDVGASVWVRAVERRMGAAPMPMAEGAMSSRLCLGGLGGCVGMGGVGC